MIGVRRQRGRTRLCTRTSGVSELRPQQCIGAALDFM
jgi:hypothetical protein